MPPGTPAGLAFGVLGDVRVLRDGAEVELGGPQPRALVAALVVAGGRVVQADELIEALWGEEPPAAASAGLHSYVSRLRRALQPEGAVVERRHAGYRLAVPREALDWCRFEDLAGQGRAALDAGDAAAAARLLGDAEALWRGPALGELRDRPFAAGLVARLEERRESARGDRMEAQLRLGRHAAVLGELAEAVRERPLDEARWAQLALARYRSGQQAEALRTLSDARRRLVDELGVEPGAALRDLELQVLRQDPALDLAPAAVATAPPSPAPAREGLVGRGAELAALLSALAESRSAARFGVVEGEPGIGKTRLLEEVAAVAASQGSLVLWGRSHESGAAPAFWPWLPLLRTLRDSGPGGTEPGLSALLDAGGGDVQPAGLFGVLDAVTQTLRRVSAERHLVLLLDDLQWADVASLELVSHLATHLQDDRVLLLATLRDVEHREELVTALSTVARRRGSRRLRLAGLDADATAALVRQTAGDDVDDAHALAIHQRAEGNPFFATELTRLLADAGQAAGAAVPAGVRDVVRQRLSALPPETLALLQVCAVAGRVVDLGLLPHVTGRPVAACAADLEPASVHRLLTEVPDGDGAVHFAHALVREVVVEDLSPVRRMQLHLAVADALEARGCGDDEIELVAEHLWAASRLGLGERAAARLEDAAEVAIRRFALTSAGDLLERAAELRRTAGTTREHAAAELRAVMRLTSVRRALRGFAGVTELLERGQELARRAGHADVERELLWAQWAMADTTCDFAVAEPLAERLRTMSEQSDDPAVQRLGLHAWAIQLWHQGRLVESRAAFDAGAAVAAAGPEETYGMSALLSFEMERRLLDAVFALHVRELLGDLPDVRERLDAIAAGLDPFGAAMVAGFAATGAAAGGDHVRVEQVSRPVVERDRDLLLSFWGAQARMHLGWATMCSGDVDEGLALFEAGHTAYEAAGLHTGTGSFLANAALALLAAGRTEQGEAFAVRARVELETYGERWPEPLVLLAEAEVAGTRGEDPGPLLQAALAAARTMHAAGMLRRIEASAFAQAG